MAVIHRLERRNARPGTKFVQSVTKRTTSPTSVGLNAKGSVGTQLRMWMNPTLSFTKYLGSVHVHLSKTSQRAVVLDHHIFDDRNGWIARWSPPQPTVFLTAHTHTKDYEEPGYRLHTKKRQITIAMTADIGCQSVLVGITFIHRLGFKKSDLTPVKTRMSAVNRDVIPILGAVVLRLSGKSGSGKVIETA